MYHGPEFLVADHLEELEVQEHEERASRDPSPWLWRPEVGVREDSGHVLIRDEGQSALQVSTVHPPFFQLCFRLRVTGKRNNRKKHMMSPAVGDREKQ